MKSALTTTVFCLLAAACGGSSGSAPAAPDFNDLIGMQARSIDYQLEDRGYSAKDGYKTSDTSYVYWWNASTRHCASVATRDGRIAAIDTVDSSNCM
ncbi:MAG: hypothetical protein M8841_00145 [marine benthic group bacterium]|jgi:hypothetical protein|nr:hypothetical protein [Gemmatimonadota bacterium]MCL7990420.1 hypothetical protein [Gemmatimonadota bacterium]